MTVNQDSDFYQKKWGYHHQNDLSVKVIAPPVAGYELRPERGLFGVFTPTVTTNLIDSYALLSPDNVPSNLHGWNATIYGLTWYPGRRGLGCLGIGSVDGQHATSDGVYFVEHLEAGGCYVFSLDLYAPQDHLFEIAIYDDSTAAPLAKRIVRGTGFWQRDDAWVSYNPEVAGDYRLSVRLIDNGDFNSPRLDRMVSQYLWHIDGLQLERNAFYPSSLVWRNPWWSGDLEMPSAGYREQWSHAGGRLFMFKDFGFRVTGFRGLGMYPVQHVTNPYALHPGSYHQRSRLRHREFSIRGSFTTRDFEELCWQRQRLLSTLVKGRTYDENPIVLRYQMVDRFGRACGRELDIVCHYAGGLEGNHMSDAGEDIELTFVSDSPYLFENGENALRYVIKNTDVNALGESNYLLFPTISDVPEPIYMEISGSGHLLSIHNASNGQAVTLDYTLPGTGYLRISCEQAYQHIYKVAWVDTDGTKTDLTNMTHASSHLPIWEMAPMTTTWNGVNAIRFIWKVDDDPQVSVDAVIKIFGRLSFSGVDVASFRTQDW